jgi:superfamily II DNA or RNA helicase
MIEGSYLSTNGYCIPKANIKPQQLNIIKKELTVIPLNIENTAEEKEKAKYKIYSITTDEIIRIPRYYGIQKFGLPTLTKYKKNKPAKIKFNGTLRDYQIPIVDACLSHIKEKGGGLLVVPCASGKTSMSIYIASQLKAKTLVITHKTFLQEQWIARCKQFTNSAIGIIRQKTVDVEGKDFVIAMIQSLAKRKYDPAIFKQFDMVICDETHHFSSRCFSQALAKCSAKYTMGLTATPYRGDGLMHVVNWFLGDIMYEKRIKTNNQVVAKIITFSCTDPLFKEKKRWIKGRIRPDCVKMIGNLIQIKQRNNHIVDIINSLRRTGERKILILSDRKEHLRELKEAVDSAIQEDIEAEIVDGDESKTYFYTGDTKKNERFEAEQYADILFATFQMAQEGLDIDRLNTIILATPKPDVNQAVGRVLRKVLENGDVRPLIIDIVDKLNVFIGQSEKREAFYEKSKYVSQYYYMLNDKFISAYSYLKMCGETNENLSKEIPESFNDMLEVPPVDITDIEEEPDPISSESSEKKPRKKGKKVERYSDPDDVCMF